MGRALRKRGILHVSLVLSQISLCSLHRLIRDDIFRFYDIFIQVKAESVVPDYLCSPYKRTPSAFDDFCYGGSGTLWVMKLRVELLQLVSS